MAETGFGDLLRRYRIAAWLTQQELAERAGLSTRGISDLERGARSLPRKDTLQLLLQALDLSPADRASLVSAATRAPAATPQREQTDRRPALPVPLTPLIGREQEIAAVSTLLGEPAVRLVTLTGPGGTGKTRLALAVAEQLASDFLDGVVFVPLASLAEPAFVPSAIAQRLGVREATGQSLRDRLVAYLTDKRLLLILDNFEHLVLAAPLVVDLLGVCAELNVLVTSRTPLHLSGEYISPVPPLRLPDPGQLPLLQELAQNEAVRLFVDRAHALKPGFALTRENAPAVAEITRRLDGLPLALELAATRVRVLSPATLLTRLDRRLPLLTGGAQDLPDRQRTLRDTIAWSYELLPPEEQALFRKLGLFAGGWTLEAAEQMGAVPEDRRSHVLDGLAALVDHSLISEQRTGEEPRFTMLEMVREFALEQLQMHGEVEESRERHADHFLGLMEEAEPHLGGPNLTVWLDRLEAEHDNVRTALTWLSETANGEKALRLAGSAGNFWYLRGHWSEGRRWLERALVQHEDVLSTTHAKAQTWLGFLAHYQSDESQAVPALEAGLVAFRRLGDQAGAAFAALILGIAAEDMGNYAAAAERLAESLKLYREAGDQGGTAFALYHLGVVELGRNEVESAIRHWHEAIAQFREVGDTWGIASTLGYLGLGTSVQGEQRQAAGLFREALSLFRKLRVTEGLTETLADVAVMAQACDQCEQAVRLLGSAEALNEALGYRPKLPERLIHERTIEALRVDLGPTAFAASWAAGRALLVEQVITEALAVTGEVAG